MKFSDPNIFKPYWFPDGIEWNEFSTAAKMQDTAIVFRALADHFNLDLQTHFVKTDQAAGDDQQAPEPAAVHDQHPPEDAQHDPPVEDPPDSPQPGGSGISDKSSKRKSKQRVKRPKKSPRLIEDESEEDDLEDDAELEDGEIARAMEEDMFSSEDEEEDTVALRNYICPDYSDDDTETDVILNIQAREKQRIANLERNRNRESMLRETENME